LNDAPRVDGVLVDLLMAVMNSIDVWSAAARDPRRGLAWRDAATARMSGAGAYVPYEALVADAAGDVGLHRDAAAVLVQRWSAMEPWPDAAVIARLSLPYGFVTNCSMSLARLAARRSRLSPRFVLSAEEAGSYKPHAAIYREGCRRLGTHANRTLFVAGSPYDAKGARAAGLQAVLVRRRSDQHTRAGSAIPVAGSLDAIVAEIEDRR
jgi:2-haloalkanoic acid dehalogenase type II